MESSCRKDIERFSSNRPEAVGVFGYGSAVFRQKSYENNKSNPLTDVIFVVDDILEWHRRNRRLNPDDYSLLGSVHIAYSRVERIKGHNNITYFSEVKEGNSTFKYGVIEVKDFISSLSTWGNMFMAGRFHKPILKVKTREDLDESIRKNRMVALRIACLMSDRIVTRRELLKTLCGISYFGDIRMKIAENPRKVDNIVDGSFEILNDIYSMDQDFLFPLDNNAFIVSHSILLDEIDELPKYLLKYLKDNGVDLGDRDMVVEYICKYINEKNKVESKAQIMEGFITNGIVRSVPYVTAKVMKKMNGK